MPSVRSFSTHNARQEFRNPNQEIYLPFTFYKAMARQVWNTYIYNVLIEFNDGSPVEDSGKVVRAFFQRKYGASGRFRVGTLTVSCLNKLIVFLTDFSTFLAAAALILLSVGGIGIANMMLVSVSERYREIGLRKALGATDRSIKHQFLGESFLLCLIAGGIGLAVGFVSYFRSNSFRLDSWTLEKEFSLALLCGHRLIYFKGFRVFADWTCGLPSLNKTVSKKSI